MTGSLVPLGPVDGLHQDQSASESYESRETFGRFLATHCDPLEPFELTDALLNAGAPPEQQLRKVFRPVLCGCTIRDHRDNAALAAGSAVLFGVVALVGDRSPRRDVGPDVQRGGELRRVVDLAAGQMEGDRQTVKVGF